MLDKFFTALSQTLHTYDDESGKSQLETVSKDGVEIFSVGTWNGDTYTKADLESMVEAFDQVGFAPFVKAGHEMGQEKDEKTRKRVFGEPALGYVKRLYLKGETLMADLRDIPRRFANLINAGAFKRISAEIYWDYEVEGKKYPRVLKAIAFLGAKIPALTTLKEIESLYQLTESGAEYAYDDDGHEYRFYCGEEMGGSGMGLADYLLTYPRKEKASVNYRMVEEGDDKCMACRFWIGAYGGACSVVEGQIAADYVCDYFEPNPMAAKMASANHSDDFKVYMIQKRGDKWCVLTKDGSKTLGCHKTKEEAMAQLRAVEANKDKFDTDNAAEVIKTPDAAQTETSDNAAARAASIKMEGNEMEEKQVQELLENALKKQREEFEAKFAEHKSWQADLSESLKKTKEEAKREAAEEYKQELDNQAKQIDKLNRQRRSETIQARLNNLKRAGKVPRSWENRLQAIFESLPDDMVHVYTSDDKKKIEESIGETLWHMLETSPINLFRAFTLKGPEEDNDSTFTDPVAEVERRKDEWMEKHGETSVKKAYSAVLKADKVLADEYDKRVKKGASYA